MKYAITAVTGKFGKSALQELVKQVAPSDIVVLARNTKKAEEMVPTGIEVRSGDYTDLDAMTTSLKGIDRLLFISSLPGGEISREQQHQNVVTAAKNAGVSFIAYTSFPHADQAEMPLAQDHKATEKVILESNIAHAFLRNNWYLENEMGAIGPVLQGQPFMVPTENGKIGWALERFYAEAAAKVLALDEPKEVYEFSGPAKTYLELAEALSKASGKEFPTIVLTKEMLQNGKMDPGMAGFMQMLQALVESGELAEESSDLEVVLGHTLPSLEESLDEIIK